MPERTNAQAAAQRHGDSPDDVWDAWQAEAVALKSRIAELESCIKDVAARHHDCGEFDLMGLYEYEEEDPHYLVLLSVLSDE